MSWSGWGDPALAAPLAPELEAVLREALHIERHGRPAPALEALELTPVRLPEAIAAELAEIVGADHARADHDLRARHARGKSTIDLLELRGGGKVAAPDLVVSPASHDEIAAVLSVCSARRVAVIPFRGRDLGGRRPARRRDGLCRDGGARHAASGRPGGP